MDAKAILNEKGTRSFSASTVECTSVVVDLYNRKASLIISESPGGGIIVTCTTKKLVIKSFSSNAIVVDVDN